MTLKGNEVVLHLTCISEVTKLWPFDATAELIISHVYRFLLYV